MSFAVPYSSSPPSTPDSRVRTPNSLPPNSGNFNFNVTTTPVGPPVSFVPSSTPAGPPPSFFGSSQPSHQAQNKSLPNSKQPLFTYPVPPMPSDDDYMHDDDDVEEQSQEYSQGSEESIDDIVEPEESTNDKSSYSTFERYNPTSSASGFHLPEYGSSTMNKTPRGTKRSRGGAAISHGSSRLAADLSSAENDSPIPAIAKDMATQLGLPTLSESQEFILDTEFSLQELHATAVDELSEIVLEGKLSTAVEDLDQLWHSCRIEDLIELEGSKEGGFSPIERRTLPGESDPNWHKATFLATFILQLHHPPSAKGMQALAASRTNPFPATGYSSPSPKDYTPIAIPNMLLDWLDRNNHQYDPVLENIYRHNPNATADEGYWDMVLSLTIRGKIAEVIELFKKSNFQHARTAGADGHGITGYESAVLNNIERVISQAINVLKESPILQDGGDWDITGSDWALFRKRVEHAMSNLRISAEGHDRDTNSDVSTFEALNFGIRAPDSKMTRSTRNAESHVPWSIYQNLQTVYGILVGKTTEIISSAQDWIEATIGLTVWWDGEEDDEIPVGSLAMTRRSLRKIQRGSRLVDINPKEAYLRRLSYAFQQITDDEKEGLLQISSINLVQVGLASIFEGNVENVVGLLRGLSLPVASAVVEIASLGGWYNPGPSDGLMDNFDESDLLVLSSYEQREVMVSRDSIMVDYAEKLCEIDFPGALEGWEVSTHIYRRLQDSSTAEKKLLALIRQLDLTSEKRVDKVLRLCRIYGFKTEALEIAERHADYIAENTDEYGKALMYYALSHSQKKVKNVFDLLVSLCLVQSIAFPPLSTMDEWLERLVFCPEPALGTVASQDQEAASLLHLYLTGYATLRKFYDLRDEEYNCEEGEKPRLRPLARKRAAAATLIALIASASDSIYGGLYDASRDSVMHVDVLLALLGEAMVFVNQPQPILQQHQNLALLSVIESLETVSRNPKPAELTGNDAEDGQQSHIQ
ncbi:MAG: hypothetical protein Q9195_007554 [Heterodermia aff. obscurata]